MIRRGVTLLWGRNSSRSIPNTTRKIVSVPMYSSDVNLQVVINIHLGNAITSTEKPIEVASDSVGRYKALIPDFDTGENPQDLLVLAPYIGWVLLSQCRARVPVFCPQSAQTTVGHTRVGRRGLILWRASPYL